MIPKHTRATAPQPVAPPRVRGAEATSHNFPRSDCTTSGLGSSRLARNMVQQTGNCCSSTGIFFATLMDLVYSLAIPLWNTVCQLSLRPSTFVPGEECGKSLLDSYTRLLRTLLVNFKGKTRHDDESQLSEKHGTQQKIAVWAAALWKCVYFYRQEKGRRSWI